MNPGEKVAIEYMIATNITPMCWHKRNPNWKPKRPVYTTATRFYLVARETKISKPQNNHQVKKLVL